LEADGDCCSLLQLHLLQLRVVAAKGHQKQVKESIKH
jgi:hypothetical protein